MCVVDIKSSPWPGHSLVFFLFGSQYKPLIAKVRPAQCLLLIILKITRRRTLKAGNSRTIHFSCDLGHLNSGFGDLQACDCRKVGFIPRQTGGQGGRVK